MKSRLSVVALAFFLATSALAQVAEFSVNGGHSQLSSNGIGSLSTTGGTKDDVKLTNGFHLGFRMTLNTWRFMGHEFGYAYNRTQFKVGAEQVGTSIHQGLYNFLVYAVPEGGKVRPFVSGGGHFSNYIWPGLSVTQGGGSTKFGVNYGGGVKVKVSPMFQMRFDFHQYITGKPFDLPLHTGMLRQNVFSVGLGVVM